MKGRSTSLIVAVLLLAVLSVLHTWPLITILGTHGQAGSDPRGMMWSLYEQTRNLVERPLDLTYASVFYPYSDTLVVLDHQFGNAVMAVPLYLGGASVMTIFNGVLLLTFVVSGITTFLLVRRLTGSDAAALVAGCAFAFGTARVYNLEHIHLLATQWIPLALLAIHSYLERPTLQRWAGLTISCLLVAVSSWQIGVIGAVGLGIVALWTLIGDGGPVVRRGVGLLLAAAVCAALLLPLAVTYSRMASYWAAGASVEEQVEDGVIAQNSANLVDVAALPFESRSPYAGLMARRGTTLFVGFATLLLAAWAFSGARQTAPGRGRWSRILDRGLLVTGALAVIAVAAALIGGPLESLARALGAVSPVALFGGFLLASSLTAARQTGHDDARRLYLLTYATLAATGLLLALGPRVMVGTTDLGSGLWRFDLLPVDLVLRAPVRLSLLMGLGFAVLVGFGTQKLLARVPDRRRLAVAALLLLVVNVDLAFGFGEWGAVPEPTSVDRWLAESDEEGPVLEFPLMGYYWQIYASQQFYDRRNVDGMGFIRPPEIRRIRLLEDFSPLQMDLIWEHSHPRFVVVRGDYYEPGQRERVERAIADLGRALELRHRDGDDAVYELRDRGRGARLYRRWPERFLRESSGSLSFSATLSEGHPRTIGVLTVLLDDRPVLSVEGAEIAGRERHLVPFAPQDLAPGINTFEFRAGYRYRDDAEPNEVGATGIAVRADVEAMVAEGLAAVVVNGERHEASGAVLVAVDPATGAVLDTAAADADLDVAAWIAARPGMAVAAAVTDASALTPADRNAIESLGARLPGQGACAVIGTPGAVAGAAVAAQGEQPNVSVGMPERRRVQLRDLQLR